MKQVAIQIPFDDEKLEALKIFLSQKDQTAEAVIGELIDGLYRKTVPLKVREYIDKRSPVRMRENTRPTADTTIVGGSCERVSLVPGSPTIVAFRLFGTQVFTGVPMVILRGSAGICEGRFSSGRKAVRQTPRRIHSGRQSRPHFLAF